MNKPGTHFNRPRRAVAAIGIVAALGGGGALAAGVAGSPPPAHARSELAGEAALPGATCSGYRWPVKTLTDPGASGVTTTPRDTTIAAMTSLPPQPPSHKRVAPFETQTWRLSNIQLKGFRAYSDGDIHLVGADASGNTLDAELPNSSCTAGAPPALRAQMESARQAVLSTYGDGAGPGFHKLSGTATLTGVGFFDFQHKGAGAGAAPNAVELHPVLSFTQGA